MNTKAIKTICLPGALLASGGTQAHLGSHDHVGPASGLMHLLLEHGPLLLLVAAVLGAALLGSRRLTENRTHPDKE